MSNPATTVSLNGTFEDVAAFFRVSVRTVADWKEDGKLSYFKEGRNVMFGSEDVVAMKAAFYVDARGLKPGEAEDKARREWREHMLLRAASHQPAAISDVVADLQRRVTDLEGKALAA